MRTSRPFRPSTMPELEGRIVLSQVTPAGAAEVRPVALSPSEIAQSNASAVQYGVTPLAALQAGDSVGEYVSTRYNDGSTQTATVLEVPDVAAETITTYKTVDLRNNGGTETVVQTETFSPGIRGAGGSTLPFTGNDRNYTITTTLPDGSTQTQTETEDFKGHKSYIHATIDEATGGVETWTGVNTHEGPKTVSNRTYHMPDGSVEHRTVVTTRKGDLDQTSMTTIHLPHGKVEKTSSATDVLLIPPTSS